MAEARQSNLGLLEKTFWFTLNALERRLFSENLIVSNLTPYEEIHRDGIMSVRHYLPLEETEIQVGEMVVPVRQQRHRVPLVLVPPLAATSMIFDLLPRRSLVRFLLAQGFDGYLVDWDEVTVKHSNISLETYVREWMPAALSVIRRHSGEQELSLCSYCMGVLLTLMYAAVSRDEHSRNMVTVARPVDMHQSGVAGQILTRVYRPVLLVGRLLNFSLMDLPSRYLHIPGRVNSLLFKMTNPVGSLTSYWDLLVNMWDREYVKEHTTLSSWFDDMVDYPGETIKAMVVKMMLNNQMAKGRMRMGGQQARFEQIKCSILAFAGDDDKLVSPRAAHKVLEIVSSEDKEFCVVPGGHAGVFGGSRAPENMWSLSADWLSARSD